MQASQGDCIFYDIILTMGIHDYYAQFDNCLQKEEPACTNICPFHLNVLDFQDKMARHKYDRAYKDYKNAVCFPEIVAALCPEYCHNACPRKDFDGAVQLNLLEKTCVAKAKRKDPTAYNLPKKEGKVGIIGAGMGGLTCALKLLEKKYEVIVFEKDDKIGGQVKELLLEEVYLTEINRQFSKENFQIKTNSEIKDLTELDDYGFNCIYIATGANGNDFGTMDNNCEDISTGEHYFLNDDTLVLAGGSLTGKDVIQSIAHGIDMAWAIEVFLRTKKVEYHEPRRPTQVVPDVSKFAKCPPVTPARPPIFTDDETEKEASRCIRCQCDACRTYCDIVEYHDQWPLSMKEDVAMTVMPSESMIHKTPAKRLINTCTQCGLYEELCPPNIEMGDMMLEARKLLHQQGIMPPAYHGFWLDDMEHANSSLAKICKSTPEINYNHSTNNKYAYFPGCNLGAADPRYVEESYKWLNENIGETGLLLRCCGVPADWSGNEKMHNREVESLKSDWESLGKPTLITACPTCTKQINEHLPEIKTTSIYEVMFHNNKWPQPQNIIATSGAIGKNVESKNNEEMNDEHQEFSLFDPCAARNNEGLESAVRKIIGDITKDTELTVVDLPMKNKYGCCGFGGNVEVANPDFADFVAKKRTGLSENPYITYCINCRDVFVGEEKPAIHMFDILFGINDVDVKLPNLTERRYNRLELKKRLLEDCWGEDLDEVMSENNKKYNFEISIDDEIQKKMDSLKLVDTDLKEVIERSNKLNRRTYDKTKDEYICYSKLNYITCWVKYKINNGFESDELSEVISNEQNDILNDESKSVTKRIYTITNVYTHRMDIELEAIWNGRKVDADM